MKRSNLRPIGFKSEALTTAPKPMGTCGSGRTLAFLADHITTSGSHFIHL